MLARAGGSLKERIVELMEARAEAYARATFTIDTSDRSIEQVVDATLSAMAQHGLWQYQRADSVKRA
jgi:shikimate kinase